MESNGVGDVVLAARDGDDGAWRRLVERFSGLVWSVARGYRLGDADAGDVFQTTWLRLAENLNRLENPERVGAWLATTARREALRVVRTDARRVPFGDPAGMEHLLIDPDTPERIFLDLEQVSLDTDRDKAMWAAFEGLSGRCRELLRVLMATPPPSYVEVAGALNLPIGSIGPTRRRCLDRLRLMLSDRGITGGERYS